MTAEYCCPQGARLAAEVHFAAGDLGSVARRASETARRRGCASPRQLAEIAEYRANKARAADAVADHEVLCTAAVKQ